MTISTNDFFSIIFFVAVAVSAYCLATVGLGKDLHRSKRDSLYDNIYSAISDFSSGGADSSSNNNGKTLEQLSKELPEQVRTVRQSNFNNGGFQQQLPRAGKTSMTKFNVNKDCDDDSDNEYYRRRRKRKKKNIVSVEEAEGGFFLKLFMPFLIGKGSNSVVKRRKTVSFSNRRSDDTPAGTPIQRNVVNPSNPFLRSPKATTTTTAIPEPTLGFTPSQTLMSHPAVRVTTPAPSFSSSFPAIFSSSPRPSSSPLKSFSPSPSLSNNNNNNSNNNNPPITTILPPVTAFSHIFAAVPSATPRPRPRQPRPPKPSFSTFNRRPTPPSPHPIFTNFAFDDYDTNSVNNDNSGPQILNHFSSFSFLPQSASLRVQPSNTLGRQRQVVVDGFPAGLPAGTPQGVIIALASMVESEYCYT